MSIFGAIGHWFEGLWKGISGQLKTSIEQFLKTFVTDDLGKLAVDAVEWVEAGMPGAASTLKRDTAVQMFKQDLMKAGHDLANFAESTLNWFVETALQAVKAEAAKVTAHTPTSTEP